MRDRECCSDLSASCGSKNLSDAVGCNCITLATHPDHDRNQTKISDFALLGRAIDAPAYPCSHARSICRQAFTALQK